MPSPEISFALKTNENTVKSSHRSDLLAPNAPTTWGDIEMSTIVQQPPTPDLPKKPSLDNEPVDWGGVGFGCLGFLASSLIITGLVKQFLKEAKHGQQGR